MVCGCSMWITVAFYWQHNRRRWKQPLWRWSGGRHRKLNKGRVEEDKKTQHRRKEMKVVFVIKPAQVKKSVKDLWIFRVLYPSLPTRPLNSNMRTHLLKWVFICNVIHQNCPIRHSVIYWAQGMKSFLTCCVPYWQVDFLPTKVDFLIHKGCLKYTVKTVNPECFFYELKTEMFI